MKQKGVRYRKLSARTICMQYILLICGSLTVFDTFSVAAVLSVLVMLGGMGKSFGLPRVTTTIVMMRAVATKTNPDITLIVFSQPAKYIIISSITYSISFVDRLVG
jgi:hypothetical protein